MYAVGIDVSKGKSTILKIYYYYWREGSSPFAGIDI